MSEGSDLKKMFLSGNEAVARGAYEAGVVVATAYPGTPSSEITPSVTEYPGINVEWSINEKVALEVGIGASFCGARTLVSMKHVGVNVAADPLMTLSYIGVKGGLVIACADDPGMHSSQNEQDNRNYARFAKIPLLEPSDSQEAKDFTKEAFLISEKFDTPVLLRLTTRICHAKTVVSVCEPEKLNRDYVFEKNPEKFVMVPARARKRHVFVEQRLKDMADFAETTPLNRIEYNDKKIGIICSGVVYQYVKESFPDASVLKLGFSYPLCKNKIREFADCVEKVYLIEELDNLLFNEIKSIGIDVDGKPDKFILGELNPNKVYEIITGESTELSSDLPNKPPVMCAGCPHRVTFSTLKKYKAIVTGDIGCYTLGSLPPLSALDTCVCMGAGIGNMHGITKVVSLEDRKKVVSVIGDSTFFHSGITGVVNNLYNKGVGTILVLDNRTTAMTGKQDHPGTGYTINQEPTVMVMPEDICKAVGVKHVEVVDPYDCEALEVAIRKAMDFPELSVLVMRRECVLKVADPPKEVAEVFPDKCVKCNQCLLIGCPAISKELPPVIDENLCNGCGLCEYVCKVGAIKCKKI